MPFFTIEATYRIPVYRQHTYEADTVQQASRPRVNAFGGGAHVLDLATRETIAWTDTNGWLARTLATSRAKRRSR